MAAAFALVLVFGLAPAANAAQVDTNTLRLQGARSEGGMLLPSSRVLERSAWDFSLTYGHEGGVLRTETPSGDTRGKNLFNEVAWIEDRDLMYLQFAASPAERLELLAGLPLLLGQTVTSDSTLDPPRSGASAFGDLRLGLRYALVGSRGSPWGASVQGGLLVPSGGNDYGMGDTQARANLSGSVGFQSEDGWSAHLHVGHQMGQMRMVADDQIIGDTAFGGLVFLHRHELGGRTVQWSLEGVMASVLSAQESGRDPVRTSLEILGGGRYFLDAFYFDLGAGVGAIDNGVTPAWRVLASLGVMGLWAKEPPPPAPMQAAAPAPAPQPIIQVIQPTQGPDPRETFKTLEVEERAIFFEVGKAELDLVAQGILRSVALNLLETDRGVLITGYADDQGSPERNEELSRRRANVVRDALIQAGVSESRLRILGQGDRAPVAPSTDFGRSINRRVTFTFVDGGSD